MYEKIKKISRLEEQYEKERRVLDQKMQETEDQLHTFRRETEELFENVRYLTREDEIDLEALNWKLMNIDDEVLKEGRKYREQLDEDQTKLSRDFDRSIEQIEEDYRKELRKNSEDE